MERYLSHHGIKGMKWGVRRFQNPDGTLTQAGKKRYYDKEGRLTRAGNEFNRERAERLKQYKKSVRANVSLVNPQFDTELQKFKKLNAENRDFAEQEHQKWLSGTDYRGLDYYQFKNERTRRYDASESGKRYYKSRDELARMIDEAAREHPLYDKQFKQLRSYTMADIEDDFITVDFGRTAVNQIMSQIEYLED